MLGMVPDVWVPYKCQFLSSPLLVKVTGSRLHLNAMPRTVEYMLQIWHAPPCLRTLKRAQAVGSV